MIRCHKCGKTTQQSFSFRLSEYGEFPATYACAGCGGEARTPEEARIAWILDELNRWSGELGFKDREFVRGLARFVEDRHGRRGTSNRFGLKSENWSVNDRANAIGAELFSMRKLGLRVPQDFWMTPPTKEGDIGPGLQIRSTTLPNGRLILHEDDDDSHTFILVTGVFPKYTMAGWIIARDGKIQGNWKSLQKQRPAYVVERENLKPMQSYAYTPSVYIC